MAVTDNRNSETTPSEHSGSGVSPDSAGAGEAQRELLSALADGECGEFELRRLLRDLAVDSAKASTLLEDWNRTQMVSDLLNRPGNAASSGAIASPEFASRVSAALEPEVPHRDLAAFWKPFSQTLVAASVAAVALVGIQQINYGSVAPQGESLPSAVAETSSAFSPVVIPEGFELPELQAQNVSASQTVRLLPQPQASDEQAGQPELDPVQLNSYIQEALNSHYEASVQASGTVFPYIRSADVKTQ